LSHLYIKNNCHVQQNLEVKEKISGYSLSVIENIKTDFGSLYIGGNSNLEGLTTIYNNLNVKKTIDVTQNVNVYDCVNVMNNIYSKTLHVNSSVKCDNEIQTKKLNVLENFKCDGLSFFSDQLNANAGLSVTGKTVLNNTTGFYNLNDVKLEVRGATIVRGTLVCNGLLIQGNLLVYGDIYYTGRLIHAANMPNTFNL
jgi:hypothetical protein